MSTSNSFLKSVGLGEIDLSLVEPIFDEVEMPETAEPVGYLNSEEKAIFLAACFCSERVIELDEIVGEIPDPLSPADQKLFDESCQWASLRDLCILMVNWLVRERLKIGYKFFSSVREDFLVFQFPLTPAEESICAGCPYHVSSSTFLN
jgi:hypothetical protein